jgi:hypothetical protein
MTPQDPWPRYAVLADALKLSYSAASNFGLEKRPTLDWTLAEILLVALKTLDEEKRHRSDASPQGS